jgi:hypothetical protein
MSFTQEEAIARGGKQFRLKNDSLAEYGVPKGGSGVQVMLANKRCSVRY